MSLCPGLEVYPSRTQLPGLLPQPVLAGVVGGICFLGVAVLVSILAACLMNRRRAARRHRKRMRQGRVLSLSSLGCPHPSTLTTGVPSTTRPPEGLPIHQLLPPGRTVFSFCMVLAQHPPCLVPSPAYPSPSLMGIGSGLTSPGGTSPGSSAALLSLQIHL